MGSLSALARRSRPGRCASDWWARGVVDSWLTIGSHLLGLGCLGDLAAWVSGEGPREVTIRRGRACSHPSDPWPTPGLGQVGVDRKYSMQLHARVDAQLREGLAQVVLDGAGADE